MYDVYEIRKDFPVLAEKIHGKPNVFLDSAASAQKPVCVLDKMNDICRRCYANVHRGIYQLSEETTAAYENARRLFAVLLMLPLPMKLFSPATRRKRLIWWRQPGGVNFSSPGMRF